MAHPFLSSPPLFSHYSNRLAFAERLEMRVFPTWLFLLLAHSLCAAALPISSYPINWSLVPVEPPAARSLNSPLLGSCVCDVSQGLCDINCCCDPDCSSEITNGFKFCLPDQFGYPDVDYCYTPNKGTKIERVNNKNVYLDRDKQGQSAICVVRANHPNNLYRYFSVPSSSTTSSAIRISDWPTIVTSENPSSLVPGQQIFTFNYDVVNNFSTYTGALRFPLQNAFGTCSQVFREATFLAPTFGSSCAMKASEACNRFPVSVLGNRFIASDMVSTKIPVTLRALNSDGTVLGVLDPLQLFNQSLNSYVDGTTCVNTVISEKTVIYYTANSAIASAVTDVVLRNVLLDKYISRSVSVFFEQAKNNTPAANIISATPGYVVGSRVRVGSLQSDFSATGATSVLERVGGLAMPSGGRLCQLQNFQRVGFFQSVLTSGCLLRLSTAELQSTCGIGTAGILNQSFGVSSTNQRISLVARTADALTNDTTSWISLDWSEVDTLSPSPGYYDSVARRCSNIVTGVKFQLVVARAGIEYNPQDVIISAFAQPILGSWQIKNASDFTQSAEAMVNLEFRVAFKRFDEGKQATIRRKVKAPPILPKLDDTVFYPFRKPQSL